MIRFIRGVFAILMVPALMAVMPSSASAEPEDPNDGYEIYEGGFMGPLNVLDNDGFTVEDNAWVCRAEQPPAEVAFVDVYNGQLSVYLSYGLEPGTVFSFTYYGCNEDMTMIVPATVTIIVKDVLRPVVRKTERPGRVKFKNPNQGDALACLYGSFKEPAPDGEVIVEAGTASMVRTERRRLDWICWLGPDYVFAGDGSVRRIEQTSLATSSRQRTVSDSLIKRWREQIAQR